MIVYDPVWSFMVRLDIVLFLWSYFVFYGFGWSCINLYRNDCLFLYGVPALCYVSSQFPTVQYGHVRSYIVMIVFRGPLWSCMFLYTNLFDLRRFAQYLLV